MLVLQGMLLIDGSGKEPIENALVVVEEDKIRPWAGSELIPAELPRPLTLREKPSSRLIAAMSTSAWIVSDPFASLVKDSDATTTLKAARKALKP